MTLDQFLSAPDAPTSADFAADAGISEASISRIRKGMQNISRDVMIAIVRASKGRVTADSLLIKAEPPEQQAAA
jgi:DNA-binding transcriptional regulator YdaS (Cro superfamily)